MKSIKQITVAILLLSGSSLAFAANTIPTCPTAEQLREQVKSFAYATETEQDPTTWNVVAKPFSIENISWGVVATFTTRYTDRPEQALGEGIYRFNTSPLNYQPTPTWDDNRRAYKCDYTPAQGNITVEAITPPAFGFAKSI